MVVIPGHCVIVFLSNCLSGDYTRRLVRMGACIQFTRLLARGAFTPIIFESIFNLKEIDIVHQPGSDFWLISIKQGENAHSVFWVGIYVWC